MQIDSLKELNEVVNAVANRALDVVAQCSTSGQRYIDYSDVSDLISKEDFFKYADFIVEELNTREEILEPVVMDDGQLDINMGLAYCKFYQWCDGDEEIFGCSFEDWLEMDVKPVHHTLSLSRMAEIGEKAVDFLRDPSKAGQEISAQELGITGSEWESLKEKDVLDVDYIPGKDLYVGSWRVHIAATGENHGTFMHLVNTSKPIVEFYDMNHIDAKYCPNGQFTGGQYYVDTILGKDGYGNENYPQGLSLQGDCPAWTVSHEEMKIVVAYLKSFEAYKAVEKPALSHLIQSAQQKADPTTPEKTAQKTPDSPQR